ncbi:hypothetical protein [Streptomyces sp. NPDC092903]|uniref:NHL domain-containing protein n=1 Tax=Streptomyces sp. NPDC092903 TaxID=3366017 RepID=UPI003814BA95
MTVLDPDAPLKPGYITTFAGNGKPDGPLGDNGPATLASLSSPKGLAVRGDGAVFIADTGHHRVRMVDTQGTITTFAGTGVQGYDGDGGPAVKALLDAPVDVALDRHGNVYIADGARNVIRKVDASSGTITTIAQDANSEVGRGLLTIAVDSQDRVFATADGTYRLHTVNAKGHFTAYVGSGHEWSWTWGVTADRNDNLYVTSNAEDPLAQAKVVDPQGNWHNIPGLGHDFNGDSGGIAVDGDGNIFVNVYLDRTPSVLHHSADHPETVIDGTGFAGDGGPAYEAAVSGASRLAVGGGGDLYIADTDNHRVRLVAEAITAPTMAARIEGTAASPGTVAADTPSAVDFTWTVASDGPAATRAAVVAVKLPEGSKVTSTMPETKDISGSTVTWNYQEYHAGTTAKYKVTAVVTAAAGTTPAAAVNVDTQKPGPDWTYTPLKDSIPLGVVTPGTVSVSNTATAPTVVPEAATTGVTFSWEVDRAAPGTLEGVTVTAQLPGQAANVTFTPQDGKLDNGKVTWTLHGQQTTQPFTVTADVTPPNGTVKVLAAPLTGPSASADVSVRILPAGELALLRAGASPAQIPAGQARQVVFSWEVDRAAPGTLEGVTVTAQLPGQAANVTFTPQDGKLDNGKVTWTLHGQQTTQPFTVTADVTLAPEAAAALHVLAVPPVGKSAHADPQVTATASPTLSVPAWKAFPSRAAHGSHVALSWKVSNDGQAPAQGVTAKVVLPVGLSPVGEYADTTDTKVWDKGTRTLTPNVTGSLRPGAHWWITVVASVDSDAPETELEASITLDAERLTAAPSAPAAKVSVVGTGGAVWTVEPGDVKSAFLGFGALKDTETGGSGGLVGGIGGLIGGIGGIGGAAASTAAAAAGAAVAAVTAAFSAISSLFSWLFGGTATLSFNGGFSPFGSSGGGGSDTDTPQPKDEDVDEEEKKENITRLWFTKATCTPDKPEPGNEVTLVWELKNTGPKDDATSVAATVTLPDTLTLTEVTGDKGTWTSTGNGANGSIGTLKPNETATVTVTATVGKDATGTKNADATAFGAHATAAYKPVPVPVAPTTGLSLTKGQVEPQPAEQQKQVTYTWFLTANKSAASKAEATITWPETGLDDPKVTVDDENVPFTGTSAVHQFPSALEPGRKVKVILSGKITKGTDKDIAATVSATAWGMSSPVTDTATANLKPRKTGLRTWGRVLPRRLTAGYGATYVWAVSNDGESDLPNVALTAQVPAGGQTMNARATRGGVVAAGKVTWDKNTVGDHGTLKPGTQWIATVDVDLRPDATGSLPPVTATATADPSLEDTSNKVDAAITATSRTGLTGTAEPGRVTVNSTTTYTFTLTNSGPSTLADAALTITLPPTLTPTAATVNGTALTPTPAGNPVTVQLPPLPPSATRPTTVTLTVKAGPGTTGLLATSAVLTRAVPAVEDPMVNIDVLVIDGSTSLQLVPDSAEPLAVRAGTTCEAAWTTTNEGSTAISDVKLVLTPPTGVTVLQVRAGSVLADLSRTSSTVTAQLGAMPLQTTLPVTATIAVAGDVSGTLALGATLDAHNSRQKDGSRVLDVTREALLVQSPSMCPNPPTPGSEHAFAWTVVNAGPSTGARRTVTATAPAGIHLLAADPPATPTGQTLTWNNLPTLDAGQAWDLTIIATVDTTVTHPKITLDLN